MLDRRKRKRKRNIKTLFRTLLPELCATTHNNTFTTTALNFGLGSSFHLTSIPIDALRAKRYQVSMVHVCCCVINHITRMLIFIYLVFGWSQFLQFLYGSILYANGNFNFIAILPVYNNYIILITLDHQIKI